MITIRLTNPAPHSYLYVYVYSGRTFEIYSLNSLHVYNIYSNRFTLIILVNLFALYLFLFNLSCNPIHLVHILKHLESTDFQRVLWHEKGLECLSWRNFSIGIRRHLQRKSNISDYNSKMDKKIKYPAKKLTIMIALTYVIFKSLKLKLRIMWQKNKI